MMYYIKMKDNSGAKRLPEQYSDQYAANRQITAYANAVADRIGGRAHHRIADSVALHPAGSTFDIQFWREWEPNAVSESPQAVEWL